MVERHRDRRFLLDALAEEAVDPGAQRDGAVDDRVRAGDVGADLDQVLGLAVGGQQPAQLGRRRRAARGVVTAGATRETDSSTSMVG